MSAPLTPAMASSSSVSAARPIASSIALGDTTATASGSIAAAAPTSKSLTAAIANGVNGPATGTTTTAAAGIASMTAITIVTEMIAIGIVTEIATATITATAPHF